MMRKMTIIVDLLTNMGIDISKIVVDYVQGTQTVLKSERMIAFESIIEIETVCPICHRDTVFCGEYFCIGCNSSSRYCGGRKCAPRCNWCVNQFCDNCMANDKYCQICDAVISHLESQQIRDVIIVAKYLNMIKEKSNSLDLIDVNQTIEQYPYTSVRELLN
jgi:hypothetical protein